MDAVREERVGSGNACASIEKEVGEDTSSKGADANAGRMGHFEQVSLACVLPTTQIVERLAS